MTLFAPETTTSRSEVKTAKQLDLEVAKAIDMTVMQLRANPPSNTGMIADRLQGLNATTQKLQKSDATTTTNSNQIASNVNTVQADNLSSPNLQASNQRTIPNPSQTHNSEQTVSTNNSQANQTSNEVDAMQSSSRSYNQQPSAEEQEREARLVTEEVIRRLLELRPEIDVTTKDTVESDKSTASKKQANVDLEATSEGRIILIELERLGSSINPEKAFQDSTFKVERTSDLAAELGRRSWMSVNSPEIALAS